MRAGRAGYDAGGYVTPGRGGYSMPPASAFSGALKPPINFIDQRPAGSADIEPITQRRANGEPDFMILGVKSAMGKRAGNGQGPFK